MSSRKKGKKSKINKNIKRIAPWSWNKKNQENARSGGKHNVGS